MKRSSQARKRREWAWVMTCVVSCNPAWLIANTVYGRHRWHEFEGGKVQPISAPATI